jgi:hypothetical protein
MMTDQQVFQLLIDKIDSLDEKVVEGFRRVNGRLDKHDDTINSVQTHGCARYSDYHKEPPTRVRQAAETSGIVAVVLTAFEVLKALAGKL